MGIFSSRCFHIDKHLGIEEKNHLKKSLVGRNYPVSIYFNVRTFKLPGFLTFLTFVVGHLFCNGNKMEFKVIRNRIENSQISGPKRVVLRRRVSISKCGRGMRHFPAIYI